MRSSIHDTLIGREFEMRVVEPYEIATPLGGRGFHAAIREFVMGDDGTVYAEISMDPPLLLKGVSHSSLLAAPRHLNEEWSSLLVGNSLTVQLGRGEISKSRVDDLHLARVGSLIAVGHLIAPKR